MAVMIWTWRRGTAILMAKTRRTRSAAERSDQEVSKNVRRSIVTGTAVFLTSDPDFAPTALLHNLKHNKVLHEHNVILTIETAQTPRVDLAEPRIAWRPSARHFTKVRAALRFYGIAERPQGAGDRAQARLAIRHHVDVLFRLTAIAQAIDTVGNAALAGPPFHHHESLSERRDGLFPDSDRTGG